MGRFGGYFKWALAAVQPRADNGCSPTLPMPLHGENSAKSPCPLFSKDRTPPDVVLTSSPSPKSVGRLDFAITINANRYSAKSSYSLSIINRPSELLTRTDRVAATKALAVTLDVNLSRTSLGAGLRAVRPERSFRDLSTTIDAHDD